MLNATGLRLNGDDVRQRLVECEIGLATQELQNKQKNDVFSVEDEPTVPKESLKLRSRENVQRFDNGAVTCSTLTS